MPVEEAGPEGLHVGDYIFLNFLRVENDQNIADGYLSAEGIISEDVQLDPSSSGMSSHLFCIHIQRQYSAYRELEDFKQLRRMDAVDQTRDPAMIKYRQALDRGYNNEQNLNELSLQRRLGTPLCFGDTVQLYHVQSEKYLTVLPDQLAEEERENLRIILDSFGSALSWVKLMPRYKIDKVGDRITSKHEISISIAERVGEYVHVAEKEPREGKLKEINCSLEISWWSINLYQEYAESIEEKQLLTSQLVILQDPETLSSASMIMAPVEEYEDNEITEAIQAAHTLDKVILDPDAAIFNSNALWIIEKKSILKGGAIKWKGKKCRVRHVNSGMYLALIQPPPEKFDNILGTAHAGKQVIGFSADPESSSTLFHIHQTHSAFQNLKAGSASIFSHKRASQYVTRGPILPDRDGYSLIETDSNDDGSGSINILFQPFTKDMQAPGANLREPYDVYVGLSIYSYLKKYEAWTEMPINYDVSSIWPLADISDEKFFDKLIERSTNFVRGFPVSQLVVGSDDRADPGITLRRQNLLREQGSLQKLLSMVNTLIPISEATDITVSDKEKRKSDKEEFQDLLRMGSRVLSQCFELMYACIKGNPTNQLYVADFMPVLLKHLGEQEYASKCVTEMLNTNMELQEEKIKKREIAIFIEKLRRSKMNPKYLKLVQACCSCMENGVDGNQGDVAEMIFDDLNDVVIQMHADYTKLVPFDWGIGDGLYIPTEPVLGSPLLGDELVTKGLPPLSLSWTTSTIQFSPLGLFGKLSVPIEDMFRQIDPNKPGTDDWLAKSNASKSNKAKDKKAGPGDKSNPMEQKQQIADYFLAQLSLFAEMCLDRNYIAMQEIMKLFSYEALVTVLQLQLKDSVKAMAAHLLLYLHVDREPQVEMVVPCLTRTWSEISKEDKVAALPCVDIGRHNHFGLLQHIISQHMRAVVGKEWTEYSLAISKLLVALVKFNFYGQRERIEDLIGPILLVLDRRGVVRAAKKEDTEPMKVSKSSTSLHDVTLEEEKEEEEEGEEEIRTALEAKLAEERPTEKFIYDTLESVNTLIFILALVTVAIGLTIYMVVVNYADDPGTPLYNVSTAISCVFFVEVAIRMYCYSRIKGDIVTFFYNKFNLIDILCVLVDLAFFAVDIATATFLKDELQADDQDGSNTNGGSLVKALRLLRLVRLVRVFRAAKLVHRVLHDDGDEAEDAYSDPIRYSKFEEHEILTMVEFLRVLSYIQKLIEDRNVSIFLKAFHKWEQEEDTPIEDIYASINEQCGELTLARDQLNDILIDVAMYDDADLVQEVLDITVAHYSSRRILMDNARSIQLLVSTKRERQFRLIDRMLRDLESNAETQELWGNLLTEDDRNMSKKTHDIIAELLFSVRSRREVLEFDEEFAPEKDVQDLLRNLGFFNIAFKVFDLTETFEEDEETGELNDISLNTREIVRSCNELMYWFLLDNPSNQTLAFQELEFFMGTLDDEIDSHRVIRAIFRNNEYLMKKCPKEEIIASVQRITKNGKRPQYLTLLNSITYCGDKNIVENQFEVIKNITAKLPKVVKYICSTDSEEYKEKQELMMAHADQTDVSVDALPEELAYHIYLIEVLSGCTVGRLNITSIEAKVQSLYGYVDILKAILDPVTILIARIKLALHFFNSIVEVEMRVSGLDRSALVWTLLKSFPDIFVAAKKELMDVCGCGWEHESVSRQRIEYALVCAMITGGFLSKYYSRGSMRLRESEEPDQVQMTLEDAEVLFDDLYTSVKDMHEMDFPVLSAEHKAMLESTCFHISEASIDENKRFKKPSARAEETSEKVTIVSMEKRILGRYGEFIELLEGCDEMVEDRAKESMGFIQSVQDLPFQDSLSSSDVRYESFIRKMVIHMQSQVKVSSQEKRLEHKATESSRWVLQAFRTMIEDKWGMDIYARDDDGGEEQDEASAEIVEAFNKNGVTGLCLDMIAPGIHESVQLEAIKLCVAMLFKEGGALDVQEKMFEHLSTKPSELFFLQLRNMVQELLKWHQWQGVKYLEEEQEPDTPEEIIVIRFIQLMSEGHFRKNQEIMREQSFNSVSYNICSDLVEYLTTLSRLPCQTSTSAANAVGAAILEVIQGPCVGNQYHFCLNTDLIETSNRMLRAKDVQDSVHEDEIELKKCLIDIFQGLLEGQGNELTIYEKMLSVLHIDVIVYMALGDDEEERDEEDEDQMALNNECLVLLQMFCDFRPSMPDELNIRQRLNQLSEGVGSVEVMWNGVLQRRFFQIPDICQFVSDPSKQALVQGVERNNIETKLLQFVEAAHLIHKEITYQVELKEKGLDALINPVNLERCSWMCFYLASVINLLFVAYYTSEGYGEESLGYGMLPALDEPVLATDIKGFDYDTVTITTVVRVLNILLIVFAFLTLFLFEYVKAPIIYKTLIDEGYEENSALLTSTLDTMAIYYMGVLVLSILGLTSSHTFLTFLLFDIIVKNAIAQAVLKAVVQPGPTLVITLLIVVFIAFIYSFFIFSLFPDQIDGGWILGGASDCGTLYGCFVYTFNYGLRFGSGLTFGGFSTTANEGPYYLYVTWFFVTLVIILNVVSGVIIMTFADLRQKKNWKDNDIVGRCFMCGIEKDVFEKQAGGPEGFKDHIRRDQNMWNYLYFIIFIFEQDKDDDDGLEWYIRRCIDSHDLSWFPINKAMVLDREADHNADLVSELHSDIKLYDSNVNGRISFVCNELTTSINRVVDILANESKQNKINHGVSGGRHNSVSSAKGSASRRSSLRGGTPSQGSAPGSRRGSHMVT